MTTHSADLRSVGRSGEAEELAHKAGASLSIGGRKGVWQLEASTCLPSAAADNVAAAGRQHGQYGV